MLGGVAQLGFDCDFFAFAPYAEADFFSRRNGVDHDGKVAGRTYFSAVEAEDDVARLQAGTFCGAAGKDFGNQCAAGFIQTERLCQTVGYFLNNHAQLSALDFAGVFSCSATFMATSIGMAKEMPMNPPLRLYICELMPTTCPFKLNSGRRNCPD